MDATSYWFCPRCSVKVEGITFQYLAEAGIPYCSECDCDMEFSHEEKVAESLISATIHDIVIDLRRALGDRNWSLVITCIDRLYKLIQK
jgi:transcription initiation factor IIE alpha subunit